MSMRFSPEREGFVGTVPDGLLLALMRRWPDGTPRSTDNDFNWRGKTSAFLIRGFVPQRNGLTLSQNATALKDARGETGTVIGMSARADARINGRRGD